jgi:rod shape-determining protein MreD
MKLLPDDEDVPGERIRRLMPSITVALATLLMALPIPLAWGAVPHVALLLVIIWASLQPRLMPTWGALLLGLFADLVSGLPFGLSALLFTGAVIAVRLGEARVEGHSLVMDWGFAAILVLAAHLVIWQLLGFVGSAAPLMPLVTQALVTVLAYPLVATLAARIQRKLIEPWS